MNWLFEYWPFKSDPAVTVVLDGVGILFFAALAAYCIRERATIMRAAARA